MQKIDHALLSGLLGVESPWAVTDVQISKSLGTVTAYVQQPPARAGFFDRQKAAPAQRRLRWEHVGMSGWRCQVILTMREGEQLPTATWAGERTQPYTRGLQRSILDLLLAGATVEQLAVLLSLPFADLWRYKFRLDQGRESSKIAATAPHSLTSQQGRPPATVHAVMEVPDEAHPVWLAVLLRHFPFDARILGLRLLLTKLQRDAALHGEADLHFQAAGEIHRYFMRNSVALRDELEQIRAHAGTLAVKPSRPDRVVSAATTSDEGPASHAFELPEASDPLWLALIEGGAEIDVRVLGLRLLLSKLRTQLRNAGDDDLRMVKLVELHRYFSRNQLSLGHEIAQIQRWRSH